MLVTRKRLSIAFLMLQAGFWQQGYSVIEAKSMAFTVLQGMVAKQASIAAFGDVFLIMAGLCALGILPCLFIQDRKQTNS